TRITFPEKPDAAVRSLLKGAGFRWSPAAGCWWRRGMKGAADFLAALDRRLNPGRPDGVYWRCQDPRGFFRRYGAATAVYGDACHAALNGPARTDESAAVRPLGGRQRGLWRCVECGHPLERMPLGFLVCPLGHGEYVRESDDDPQPADDRCGQWFEKEL